MVRAAGARHPRVRCARRGGYSSAGRAPGCGPGGRGFGSLTHPRSLEPPSAVAVGACCGSAAVRRLGLVGRPPRVCEDGRMPSRRLVAVAVLPRSRGRRRGKRRWRSGGGWEDHRCVRRPSVPRACSPRCRATGSAAEAATEVVLAFSEEVNPSFVLVTVTGPAATRRTGGRGSRVAPGGPAARPGLPAGEHATDLPRRERRRPPRHRHGDLHDGRAEAPHRAHGLRDPGTEPHGIRRTSPRPERDADRAPRRTSATTRSTVGRRGGGRSCSSSPSCSASHGALTPPPGCRDPRRGPRHSHRRRGRGPPVEDRDPFA